MKKIAVVLAVAVLGGAGWFARSRGVQPMPEAPSVSETRRSSKPLGVDDLMRDVDAHKGVVVVQGVVSVVSSETGTLALIDTTEFKHCKTTTCASLSLPVSWTGRPLPAVRDQVRAEGEVQEVGGKLVFVARSLTIEPEGASRQ